MNCLLTGASGFLGKYIFQKLSSGGYTVYTIGRNKDNSHRHTFADLAVTIPEIQDVLYEKVIHVAGKAHVFPKTKKQKEEQYNANYLMTYHLVSALEKLSILPAQVIFISSVAVYGLDSGVMINEDFPATPATPYGKAKLDSEKLLSNWCKQKGIALLILRLPLIAGFDPPGNLGEMKTAIARSRYLRIKNNFAKKSIVLAQDVADLVCFIDSRKEGTYHLTDRYHPSFSEIESAFEERTGKKIKFSISYSVIRFFAGIGNVFERLLKKDMPVNSLRLDKLTSELTFDDNKAVKDLNWQPGQALAFIKKMI